MRRQIKAAAVIEKIDEGEGAKILKARGIVGIEHLAILRMRVVVPAEAIVVECKKRDDQQRRENGERHEVGRREAISRKGQDTMHGRYRIDRSYGCAVRIAD